MISAGIVGLGKAVPERVLTNHDIQKIVDTSDEWIVERTGIHERRIASDSETASSLGAAAAKEALVHAKLDPSEIDLVICSTISPDMQFPATASIIQHAVGCTKAAAFDLGAGCAGFAYAAAIAAQLVASGGFRKVLVVGSDVLSKSLDWTDRTTCVLFGDGAGAVVIAEVEEGQGFLGFDLGSDGSGSELLKVPAGGSRHPATHETVDARQHYIQMEGKEVFRFAVKVMGESAERALAKCGMSSTDVDLFVPHQANVRIIDSAMRRLNLPPDKVYVNVGHYGNTSAASIPIALHEAYYKGLIKQDDTIVTVGFGAGLTWASCVLRWTLPTIPAQV